MPLPTSPADQEDAKAPPKAASHGSSSIDTEWNGHPERMDALDKSAGDESRGLFPVWGTLSSLFTLMKQPTVPDLSLIEDKRRSDDIDAWLKAEAIRSKRQFRVMLLGDFEQTDIFWKQARLLSTPLSEQEKIQLRDEVQQTVLRGFKSSLCELLQKVQGEKHREHPSVQANELLRILQETLADKDPDDTRVTQAQRLISICQDPEFYNYLQKRIMLGDTDRQKLGLEHGALLTCTCEADEITLSQLQRVFAHDYQLTEHDWFHFGSRYQPVVREACIKKANYMLLITDLSSKTGRREKWIHIFDDCTCLVFLADITRYSERLPEDETRSVLQENLWLFESVANSQRFLKKPLLLVLTRATAFKAKLAHTALSNTFPDYVGNNAEEAVEYVRNRFLQLVKRDDFHVCISDISDSASFSRVIGDMETSVLKNALGN